jgi:hypothetical protein
MMMTTTNVAAVVVAAHKLECAWSIASYGCVCKSRRMQKFTNFYETSDAMVHTWNNFAGDQPKAWENPLQPTKRPDGISMVLQLFQLAKTQQLDAHYMHYTHMHVRDINMHVRDIRRNESCRYLPKRISSVVMWWGIWYVLEERMDLQFARKLTPFRSGRSGSCWLYGLYPIRLGVLPWRAARIRSLDEWHYS